MKSFSSIQRQGQCNTAKSEYECEIYTQRNGLVPRNKTTQDLNAHDWIQREKVSFKSITPKETDLCKIRNNN